MKTKQKLAPWTDGSGKRYTSGKNSQYEGSCQLPHIYN